MKRTFLFFIFLLVSISQATPWEIGIAVQSQQTKTIYVYAYDSASRACEFFGSGNSNADYGPKPFNGINKTINIVFDIDGGTSNTLNKSFERNKTYYLVIDNWWMSISGSNNDIWFSYADGSGFAYGDKNLNAVYTYSIGGQDWSTNTIKLASDFGSDRNECSGNIQLNNAQVPTVGTTATERIVKSSSFPHTISGIDNQYVNYYYRKWRKWAEDNQTIISRSLNSAGDSYFTAKYAKQTVATISTSPSETIIKLNGNPVNSNQNLYDDQQYTFLAENHVSLGVSFTFNRWVYDGLVVTNNTIKINNPSAGPSLTAYFTGIAISPTFQFTSSNGQYIKLEWSDHQNPNVTKYQVWRMVSGGSAAAISGLLDKGTTSFTDYAYIQNPNGVAKLFYAVKAYYEPSKTWNDPGYILNREQMDAKVTNNTAAEKLELVCKEVPTEYSISNYPNPFNPTTVIKYELPKDGFVTLKVYDILGKEVATLVNENKQAGYYNATFNAKELPSGIYIYSLNTNGFNQSKKMILTK